MLLKIMSTIKMDVLPTSRMLIGAVTKNLYDNNNNLIETIHYAKAIPPERPCSASKTAIDTALASVANASIDTRVRYVYDAHNRLTYSVNGVGLSPNISMTSMAMSLKPSVTPKRLP